VDRSTFKIGEDILNYLWRENYIQDKSVILVGNKADLARSRVITTTGEYGANHRHHHHTNVEDFMVVFANFGVWCS
jgi:ribosome biogenesis GTPase A